jgi:NhaP-type Na+/H+ or K+/H+ antiporter
MDQDKRATWHVPSWVRTVGIWGGIFLLILGIIMLRVRIWGPLWGDAKRRTPRKRPRTRRMIRA